MAPRAKRVSQCQICSENASKYTCPRCAVVYCSVACFKTHKESSCKPDAPPPPPPDGTEKHEKLRSSRPITNPDEQESLEPPMQLRTLASLNWPYIPEDSSNDDPLKRADPKVLQLSQYEAIAMSPQVRKVLEKHDKLPALLAQIDKLRGHEREEALQQHLGVTPAQIDSQLRSPILDGDTLALRELAEAIEGAVRKKDPSALGLDWGE